MFRKAYPLNIGAGASKEKSPVAAAVENAVFYSDYRSGEATPIFDSGTDSIYGQQTGYSFTRSDSRTYATDFEGIARKTQINELPFNGQRRVQNFVHHASSWTSSTVNVDVERNREGYRGSGKAIRLTDTAGAIHTFNKTFTTEIDPIISAGQEIRSSIKIRILSSQEDYDTFKTGTVSYFRFLEPSIVGTDIDLLTTCPNVNQWYHVCSNVETAAGSIVDCGVTWYASDSGILLDFEIDEPMVELVEGQDNQNPSEFVSNLVGTGKELQLNFPGLNIESPNNKLVWSDQGYYRYYSNTRDSSQHYLSIDKSVVGVNDIPDNQLYCMDIAVRVNAQSGSNSLEVNGYFGYNGGPTSFVDFDKTEIGTIQYLSTIGRINNTAGVGKDAFWLEISPTLDSGEISLDILSMSVKKLDHGSNVDGIKYFPYANGNTVSGNIVTEKRGKYFQPMYSKGLGLWESSTNLITDSHSIGNAVNGWQASGATRVQSSTAAPDLGTCWDITDDFVASAEFYYQTITGLAADTVSYTGSCYFLKDSNTSRFPGLFLITWNAGTSSVYGVTVNTSTGEVEASTGYTPDDIFVEDIGDWWRVSVTGANDSQTEIRLYIYPALTGTSGGAPDVATIGTCTVWGAQLEQNPYPTPLIQTTGSSVTRNDDELLYDPSNYSEDSTVLIEFEFNRPANTSTDAQYLFAAGQDGNNFAGIAIHDSGYPFIVLISNGTSLYIRQNFSIILQENTRYKIATTFSVTTSNIKAYINGIAIEDVAIDTGTQVDKNPTNVYLGYRPPTNQWTDGFIHQVQIIPEFWTESELQAWSK